MITYPISFLENKASPELSQKTCSRRCWFTLLGCLSLAFVFMVVIIIVLGAATTSTNSMEQPTKWYSPAPAASGYVIHPGRSLPPVSAQANNQRKIRRTLDQTTNRGTEVHANSMFEHLGYSPHPLTSSLCDLLEGSETAVRNGNEKYAVNTPSFGNTRLWRIKRTLKRHWSMDDGIGTTSSRVRQQLLSEFIRILGNLIYQAVEAEQMNTSVLGSQDLKQVDLESLSTRLKHNLAAYIFDELDLNRDELIDFREVELFLQFYELLP
ncbi:hypothetical protein CRM22_000122 [Opisthorchis felineus]|uniref:EF-hand domain-containing protein n=1 Tax=Opisthorchis felineus TaxID=147828 RepID=A0A4S2MNE6_OPIFE|nr:hypothetical protein CRM22_000122 [Opisthorchis felineus]